jgi:ribonucleoside-diphosphate reductase subunit M2
MDSQQNQTIEQTQQQPPLPVTTPNRYTFFPIQFTEIYNFAMKQEECFWRANELDFDTDIKHWATLTEAEKEFIKHVLAFFASADSIVLENLVQRLCHEIQIPEANYFYTNQAHMENIHSLSYSLMIDTVIKDEKEKAHLFNAIEEIPCVAKKAKWAINWIQDDTSCIMTRLVAFAAVEGIFFSGSFCALFWLKKRGIMPGFTHANELISRDEGMHTDFAIMLYKILNIHFGFFRLSYEKIKQILTEAVEIEKDFIMNSLPCALIGMNNEKMGEYIEFVTDRLVCQFGYEKIYNTPNPFQWMVAMSVDGKTNFFEKRVSEYVIAPGANEDDYETDEDF